LTQIRPLRGFDRLSSAGFSQPDIAMLRAHFHGERGLGSEVENVLDIPQEHGANGEIVDSCELEQTS